MCKAATKEEAFMRVSRDGNDVLCTAPTMSAAEDTPPTPVAAEAPAEASTSSASPTAAPVETPAEEVASASAPSSAAPQETSFAHAALKKVILSVPLPSRKLTDSQFKLVILGEQSGQLP
jgi:hypothetical protein